MATIAVSRDDHSDEDDRYFLQNSCETYQLKAQHDVNQVDKVVEPAGNVLSFPFHLTVSGALSCEKKLIVGHEAYRTKPWTMLLAREETLRGNVTPRYKWWWPQEV